jgi:hypothetical protein
MIMKQSEISKISDARVEKPTPPPLTVWYGRASDEKQVADATTEICPATGTQSIEVGQRMIAQLAASQIYPQIQEMGTSIITTVESMKEMRPQNATEGMLAVQMIATNDAALMFLNRSTQEGQNNEIVDANVLRATRLMRVFVQQAEVMQKLKGKAGPQPVSVDQVHVHQGGQAIVGSVNTAGEERKPL